MANRQKFSGQLLVWRLSNEAMIFPTLTTRGLTVSAEAVDQKQPGLVGADRSSPAS
jgi:hypothetical protein